VALLEGVVGPGVKGTDRARTSRALRKPLKLETMGVHDVNHVKTRRGVCYTFKQEDKGALMESSQAGKDFGSSKRVQAALQIKPHSEAHSGESFPRQQRVSYGDCHHAAGDLYQPHACTH
jgi:hypothetical protein